MPSQPILTTAAAAAAAAALYAGIAALPSRPPRLLLLLLLLFENECPVRKDFTGGGWNDSYAANIQANAGGSCPQVITIADECFAAAHNISISTSKQVVALEGASADVPSGCSVQVNDTTAVVYFNTNATSSANCGDGVDTISGSQESLVTLGLSVSASAGVTVSITGPADGNWFGVGFNAQVMFGAYAIVVDGEGAVTEHSLGLHAAGSVLTTSVTVVNNTVSADGKLRTVVVTRALAGASPLHYSFDPNKLLLNFICALGSTPQFAYHAARTTDTIALWPQTPPPSAGGVVGVFRDNVASDQDMRNDWLGEVGYSVTPRQALTVSALGRAVPLGSQGGLLQAGANVTIWAVATGSAVVSVVVGGPGSAAAEHDGYSYANLTSPVVLEAGHEYFVTQTCTMGMPDKWTNTDGNAGTAERTLVTLGHGVFSDDGQPGVFPTNAEPTSQFAGIVTFKALLPPNLHPPPATACVCLFPAAPFGQGTGTLTCVTGHGGGAGGCCYCCPGAAGCCWLLLLLLPAAAVATVAAAALLLLLLCCCCCCFAAAAAAAVMHVLQ
jgi:hypothetical protein